MEDPFEIVRKFEAALCEYTRAPFAVFVASGTGAIHLSLEWYYRHADQVVLTLPERTYRSVLHVAREAGFRVCWSRDRWRGAYQLSPSPVRDCALRFTPGMYRKGQVQCLSFHPQKPLGLSCGGGAILHDDPMADAFYRRMRHDGRDDSVPIQRDRLTFGWHYPVFPAQAAEGLHKLAIYANRYPKRAPDFPTPDYENLREKLEGGDYWTS